MVDAPGWSELVAGEINLPRNVEETAKSAAEVPLTQAQTRETDSRSQLYDTENQSNQVALEIARANSPLQLEQIKRNQIAQAIQYFDPKAPDAPEQWDSIMQGMADGGNADAKQLVGKFTEDKFNYLKGVYTSQLAAGAGAGGGGGGARGGAAQGQAGAGYTPEQVQDQISRMSPDQVKAAADKVAQVRAAQIAIASSPNPSAEFDRHVTEFNHPEWAGHYNNELVQQSLQQLEQDAGLWTDALGQRGFAHAIGAPQARTPQELIPAGGVIYGTDTMHTKVTPLTPGTPQYIGVDADGHAIYNTPGQGETVGTHQVNAKPGGAGAGSVFERKYQLALGLFDGDQQKALDYATGRGAVKVLTPLQIQMAADAAVRAEQANFTLDPSQADARRAALVAEYTALNNQAAGGYGAGGAAPRSAPGLAAPTPDAFTPARDQFAIAWSTAHDHVVNSTANKGDTATARAYKRDIEQRALELPPMQGATPPPPTSTFAKSLHEGALSVSPIGQGWTLRNGQPVRLF